jgi:uncharacterized membrane protein HdeD (DUF308 family)
MEVIDVSDHSLASSPIAGLLDSARERIAPWRSAGWPILIVEGVLLVLAGIYFLADGQRAEYILGAIVSVALIVDGVRQLALGFRSLKNGLARDLTLIRGAVGLLVGIFVLAFSSAGALTVVGIRTALGLGVLIYGLLGLWIASPAARRRESSWTSTAFDFLLIALGLLLLYRVLTSDSIALLLGVIGWLVIVFGALLVLAGLVRRSRAGQAEAGEGPPGD